MNKDIFSGKFKQMRGRIQQKWGDITNDDLDRIEGDRKEFEGLLQERYGYSKDQAEREVDSMIRSM